MTGEIALTLAVACGALALFASNRLRADVVGLIIMATLIVTGLVTPAEGISGFANEATVTVAAMFVLSAGLVRTGAVDAVGRRIISFARGSELRLIAATMAVVMVASAFVNNTPVVVAMVPVALGMARTMGVSASRIFMPLSFASQLGGTLTLIGTSTNLLIAGLIVELGLPRLSLFQFTLPALVLAALGAAYMLTMGRWLTPVRKSSTDLMAAYELRDYLSALVVEPDSPLVGKSLGEFRFESQYGLQVVGIDRGDTRLATPDAATHVEANDVLLVRGKIGDLAQIRDVAHLRLVSPRHLLDESQGEQDAHLAEMIVLPRSPFVGQSLRRSRFRTRYGVPVLGIQRHGQPLQEHLSDITLEPGDILLVQGTTEQLMAMHESSDLALLGGVTLPPMRRRKRGLATAIMLGVVLLSAFNVLPLLTAAMLGVIAMFLSGCLSPDEAYNEVDWMVLVLLASIMPLGIAMHNTGTAQYLANGLLSVAAPLGPHGILFMFYLVTSLLTAIISNTAAALVLTPLAIAAAETVGISPLPLVVAVMLAASNSFMTPIGYQTNTFIYGPGGYRFSDFLRVGGPLNLLLLVAATVVIPWFFSFS